MTMKIDAVFDGSVFKPVEPLDMEPNTFVEIVVALPSSKPTMGASFLDVAQSLQLDGAKDWSENLRSFTLEANP